MNDNLVRIRVWGDFACFTRPEMKVERVSYPIMTPSAARGVLEAIFWKPEMYYIIDSITAIRRGKWTAFKRNELKDKISLANARKWMTGRVDVKTIEAGGGADNATPRNMLALRDVEYLIAAEIRLSRLGVNSEQTVRKFSEELMRRARLGKCFHRPALGVREFDAHFETADETAISAADNWNEDLGLMLYDVFDPSERSAGFKFLPDPANQDAKRKPKVNFEGHLCRPKPIFFRARVVGSKLDCHPDRVELISQSEEGGE